MESSKERLERYPLTASAPFGQTNPKTWLLDWIIGLILAVGTLGAWCCVWPAQNLLFGAVSGYLAYRWLEEHP